MAMQSTQLTLIGSTLQTEEEKKTNSTIDLGKLKTGKLLDLIKYHQKYEKQ